MTSRQFRVHGASRFPYTNSSLKLAIAEGRRRGRPLKRPSCSSCLDHTSRRRRPQRAAGQPTPIDHVCAIFVFVVNSVSIPATPLKQVVGRARHPQDPDQGLRVPTDHFSGESVELLKDIEARWTALREIRDSVALARGKDPALAYIMNARNADIYAIDGSFQALRDKTEREYLNQLPTLFVRSDEAVDRLRVAAATIVFDSRVACGRHRRRRCHLRCPIHDWVRSER
jgi:hypothetical protein